MIGERLADARRRKGLTLADLAVALGDRYDHSVLSRVEANKSSLRLDGLIRAASELGVSTDYLLGLTDDPTPAAQLLEQAERVREALIQMEFTGPRASEYAALGQKLYQLAESLGLPKLPDQAAAVTMPDDSMEPNIREGERLLTDREATNFHEGGIFAVRLDEDLLVRRASWDTVGGWRLVSDNPAWEPVLVAAHVVMIGEVLWAGRHLAVGGTEFISGDVLR